MTMCETLGKVWKCGAGQTLLVAKAWGWREWGGGHTQALARPRPLAHHLGSTGPLVPLHLDTWCSCNLVSRQVPSRRLDTTVCTQDPMVQRPHHISCVPKG